MSYALNLPIYLTLDQYRWLYKIMTNTLEQQDSYESRWIHDPVSKQQHEFIPWLTNFHLYKENSMVNYFPSILRKFQTKGCGELQLAYFKHKSWYQ